MTTVASGTVRLHLGLAAEPVHLGLVRHAVTTWLTEARWSRDDVDLLVFAISEAVGNVVEHAYRGMDVGPVAVDLAVEYPGPGRSRARVSVTDSGSWRPDGAAGGRGNGLGLIRAMTESAQVTTDDAGTRVRLRSREVRVRPLRPPGGPPIRRRSNG